ncbi:DUF1541 domain-containing protein [Shouchella miscanthi]|uniref:DUF1541 domain-containing protein n=1 Tax=Shouchella miscanthi TaxID=2598861 RepID=A0ABU6NJJ4_9BACI|nr:DUF1541 domain-containing protein [Shouchella miscanthi]MED4128167.1 DUF1541 domain-containing protein [Shouchella miscanthi]
MQLNTFIKHTGICCTLIMLVTGCGVHQNGGQPHPLKEHTDHFQTLHESKNRQDIGTIQQHYSDEVPPHLEAVENPTYPVGSKAIILYDAIPGMAYAVATIKGAYETTAYEVQYEAASHSEPLHYKWIIHEDINSDGETSIENEAFVQLNTSIPPLNGERVKIVDQRETTVYMIDFISNSKEDVQNFKWVTEEDLKPIKQKSR